MAGEFAGGTVLTLGSVVTELTKITGPSIKLDLVDVTSHDSANKFKEFVPGLADPGEFSLEGNFIDSAQANLMLLMLTNRTLVVDATIVFPNPEHSTWTFDCYVTAYETDEPYDNKLSFKATLKVTGVPVMAPATT